MPEYIERSYIRKMAMLEIAYTMETETDAAVVLRMIDDAPAADVTPMVHGRWIEGFDEIKCSVCRREWSYCDNDTNTFNYCPNCGAKMDGGESNG